MNIRFAQSGGCCCRRDTLSLYQQFSTGPRPPDLVCQHSDSRFGDAGVVEMRGFLGALIVMVLAGTVLVAGCATTGGGPFRPMALRPGHGIIYVYSRPQLLFNNMKGLLYISVDGREIDKLGPGLYYAVHVTPGPHTVRLVDPTDLLGNAVSEMIGRGNEAKFNVKAGRSYYVRLTVHMYTATMGRFVPTLVPQEVGKVEILETQKS